ncbi:histidine phosphatase family protein [Candidatus Woesearchaeota archaeon]|nr:histidine phosphatase family protein [Candidatus Woesearchaeota archaeon]
MLDIYLIRHAQSVMNTRPWIIGGRTNHTPLTDLGVSQSIMLGIYLRNNKILFDEVYSSPARRTQQTAEISCGVAHFPLENIILNDDLQELDRGDWQGKDREMTYTSHIKEQFEVNPQHFKPPNGESHKEVEDRMVDFLDQIVIDYQISKKQIPSKIIGIYSHGMAIKCLLRGILDIDPKMTWKIQTSNASITRIKYKQNGWYINCINESSYLKDAATVVEKYR